MADLHLPLVNQLSGTDVNRNDDCGSAVLASLCMWNRPGLVLDPGAPKDAVYGTGYRGFTSYDAYVEYAASYGITLTKETNLSNAQIVARAHQIIESGSPALVYIGWDYDTTIPHMVALYRSDPGSLTCMNPWGGISQTKTDAEWISNGFFYGQIWTAKGDKHMKVPQGWNDPHPEDPNGTLIAKNGVQVRLGFRQAILNWPGGWDPENVPLVAEYHAPVVQFHAPEFGGGQIMPCQFGMFWYTAAKGVIYEKYLGWELKCCYDLIANLQAQQSSQVLQAATQAILVAADQVSKGADAIKTAANTLAGGKA